MRGLEGKAAIVTGGGGGIGSAICKRLTEAGARVGVFDLDKGAAERTVEALVAKADEELAGVPGVRDRPASRRRTY